MLITRSINDFYFKQPSSQKVIIRGNGFVSNISEVAENNGAVSFNVEIQLTGLFSVNITEGETWDTIFTQWELLNKVWNQV